MSEPVAWRWIADHKYLCASEPEEPFKHQWEPLYPADAIERKDAVIAELTEALKRDVVDETLNAELNNAKDAAIAELTEKYSVLADKYSACADRSVSTAELVAEIARSHAAIAELVQKLKWASEVLTNQHAKNSGRDARYIYDAVMAVNDAIKQYDIPKDGL